VSLGGIRGSSVVTRTSPMVNSLLASKWTSGYIIVSACLDYLYTRVYFLMIAFELEVIYILLITCEIYLVLSCLDLVIVVHLVEPSLFRFCAWK
jgi:hypothetical protein